MSTKKRRVLFRADGNSEIGWGHVVRSLALAAILGDEYDCAFLVQQPPHNLLEQINGAGEVYVLPESSDYLEEAKNIAGQYLTNSDIVVLDGYNFGTDYQLVIKNTGAKVVSIDDTHIFHYVGDAVINHAPGVEPDRISKEPGTKLYLGLDYALLRQPFYQIQKESRTIGSIKNVFICIGGADVLDLTDKLIEACSGVEQIKEIHAVGGNETDLTEIANPEEKKIYSYKNLSASEMVELMEVCDLAICPASTLSIEAYFASMVLLTGLTADNQSEILAGLEPYDHVYTLSNFRETDTISLRKRIIEIIDLCKEGVEVRRGEYTTGKLREMFQEL